MTTTVQISKFFTCVVYNKIEGHDKPVGFFSTNSTFQWCIRILQVSN